MSSLSYESWSREDLIARLRRLDAKITPSESAPNTTALDSSLVRLRGSKPFDFAAYPRRKIALKFCYAGWDYNGLAFQNDKTPLPTVEGTLFDALASTRLIDRAAGPEGCGWERCGRTDRGVSAAGQVISLWVRSNVGEATTSTEVASQVVSQQASNDSANNDSEQMFSDEQQLVAENQTLPVDVNPTPTLQPAKEEIRYVSLLNRVLPPTIRVLAWSPVAPSFSSRFACKYRHYKYFFSPLGLDLNRMRDAASRLVGEHDFRNLCKLDPSKQITSFRRKILRADIEPCTNSSSVLHNDSSLSGRDDIHIFNLSGSAFLYHQVRHIMAILFLIGSGLEDPSLISVLMNTDKENPYPPFRTGEGPYSVIDRKPEYQMADGLPLMLWDCAYHDADVNWQTDATSVPETSSNATCVASSLSQSRSEGNLYHQLHSIHSRSLIRSALNQYFLQAASTYHSPPYSPFPLDTPSIKSQLDPSLILNIPIGGGMYRRGAARTYVHMLDRKRLESVEVVNERWKKSKGERRAAGQKTSPDDLE